MSQPLLSPSVSRARRAFPSVLFDEAHSEAWSIRAETVAQMNPRHPGDAGYLQAADALRDGACGSTPTFPGHSTAASLADRDVLVVAHPSDGTWERVTGIGSAAALCRRDRRSRDVRA